MRSQFGTVGVEGTAPRRVTSDGRGTWQWSYAALRDQAAEAGGCIGTDAARHASMSRRSLERYTRDYFAVGSVPPRLSEAKLVRIVKLSERKPIYIFNPPYTPGTFDPNRRRPSD